VASWRAGLNLGVGVLSGVGVMGVKAVVSISSIVIGIGVVGVICSRLASWMWCCSAGGLGLHGLGVVCGDA